MITLSRKLEEVTALAEEVLFHPSFPETEFRMLIDKRVQAFLTGRQKTSVIGREEFYRALCGNNNPYGRVTKLEDYQSITTTDIRAVPFAALQASQYVYHRCRTRPGEGFTRA